MSEKQMDRLVRKLNRLSAQAMSGAISWELYTQLKAPLVARLNAALPEPMLK